MDGFFYIDKPSGQTSFDVLRDMRKILGVKKIGHTGTLDPLATGGLLVAVGNYTKLIPYFEKDRKSYKATLSFDGVSASYDSETPVEFISQKEQQSYRQKINPSLLREVISQHFLGEIEQIPPKYSALKVAGKRALDRVRAGEDIEMQARKVEIFSFTIESCHYPQVIANIEVSAGTYIRSLAHDLGQYIGSGAYLTALRRTKVGALEASQLVALEDLDWERVLKLSQIFPGKIFPFSDTEILTRLSNGQRVRAEYDFPENQEIFLEYDEKISFVIEYKDGVIHPRKMIYPFIASGISTEKSK